MPTAVPLAEVPAVYVNSVPAMYVRHTNEVHSAGPAVRWLCLWFR